jgi:hypothetical protein
MKTKIIKKSFFNTYGEITNTRYYVKYLKTISLFNKKIFKHWTLAKTKHTYISFNSEKQARHFIENVLIPNGKFIAVKETVIESESEIRKNKLKNLN